MAYTARVLPPNEWPRLEGTGNTLALFLDVLNPEVARIVVVEDGERIIASMVLLRQVSAESLWIDPEYRHRVGVGRLLLRWLQAVTRALQARSVISGCLTDEMATILKKLGASPLHAEMYVMPIPGDK